jgi:hypothetical protein
LLHWILLLQEFNLVIKDKKGCENFVANNISRLHNTEGTIEEEEIVEKFSDERLLLIQERPWFVDMANFKAARIIPDEYSWQQKKKFLKDSSYFVLDDPFLFKIGGDGLLRRYVSREESKSILWHCHNSLYGGHFNGERTAAKVLQSSFYWPTIFKDAHIYVKQCDKSQRTGGVTRRNEMPLTVMQEVEVFDYWGIDFVGPFPPSFTNEYILVGVDYVS